MTTGGDSRDAFKQRFAIGFNDMISSKDTNSFYLNPEQYSEIIRDVKRAKAINSKTKKDYRRLKRFEVFNIGGVEKLIVPMAEGESNIRYYVTTEEIFDILYDTHIAVEHGGKHRMLNELNKNYKNVTQDAVKLFLSLCLSCHKRIKSADKVVRPLVFDEMKSRGQVDLIEMEACDGPFRYILVYEDCVTQFVQLRPLESKAPEDVAKRLIDVFCIFGAPAILQSDEGREFAYSVVNELRMLWKDLRIVHGEPPCNEDHDGAHGSYEDIKTHLEKWIADTNSLKWSEGLAFVQLAKNMSNPDGIKRRSPYEAMFGRNIKVGLNSSALSKDIISCLQSEEELQEALQKDAEVGDDSETIIDENFLAEAHYEEEPENGQLEVTNCEHSGVKCKDDSVCRLCQNEDQATDNMEPHAKKMRKPPIIDSTPTKFGSIVHVQIPDVERGKGYFRNTLATVIDAQHVLHTRNKTGTQQ